MNRVLVEPIIPKQDIVGSIVVPDAFQDKTSCEGSVVRIGPKVTNVQVGNRILFNRFTGEDVMVGRTHYKLILDADLLAVLEQ